MGSSVPSSVCPPRFHWVRGGNQSPRQTTREHKGVNDKQMKGRISDTCSLPLFLCLSAFSLALSPTCISFLVTAPSLAVCFLEHEPVTVLTEVDAGEPRLSRVYKHRDAPLLLVTRCLEWQWIALVCLALCLTLGMGWAPVFLPVCLTSPRACLSFRITVCLPGHLSVCLSARHQETDQARRT